MSTQNRSKQTNLSQIRKRLIRINRKLYNACQVSCGRQQVTQPRTLITSSCSPSKVRAVYPPRRLASKHPRTAPIPNQDNPFNQTENVILPQPGVLHVQVSSMVIKRTGDTIPALGSGNKMSWHRLGLAS